MSAYEQETINKVGRLKDRGKYDYETVHEIFNAAPIVHLGFNDFAGNPQVVPMIAALEVTEDDEVYVYLHGHASARFNKVLDEEGTRLTVTATLVDGLVLSLTPFHHSMNYRSSILHGYSSPLPDYNTPAGRSEKIKALTLITDAMMPERWDRCREPEEEEYKITGVIRMRVESGSAKVRTGGPKEDKKDAENAHLTSTTWSGHIPLRTVAGTPIPSDLCKSADFPNGPTEEVKKFCEEYK